jgi:predicted dehydrogenase
MTHTAFVEVSEGNADKLAKKYGLKSPKIFSSLAEALDSVSADAVLEAIPPAFRLDTATITAQAGLPLLSEKPMSDTMDNARRIVGIADESGVLHMIAQNYRYNIPAQTVKKVLQSGELGAVRHVTVEHYRGLHLPGFHQQMRYPLLQDMSIHHFDLMRFFLGAEYQTVYGRAWNPSWSTHAGNASAAVIFTFPGDVTVSYDASWCSLGMPTTWTGNWRFECEKGVLNLRDDAVTIQGAENKGDHEYAYRPAKAIPSVDLPHHNQAYLAQEFYEAVNDGKAPGTTVQDNVNSLQMVFDVIASCESGQVVTRA